jgi:hypothetical protein
VRLAISIRKTPRYAQPRIIPLIRGDARERTVMQITKASKPTRHHEHVLQ